MEGLFSRASEEMGENAIEVSVQRKVQLLLCGSCISKANLNRAARNSPCWEKHQRRMLQVRLTALLSGIRRLCVAFLLLRFNEAYFHSDGSTQLHSD